MARLVVYRPKAFPLSLNTALIHLDGREIGRLKNASHFQVDVPAGSYRMVQSWKKSLLGKWIKDLLEIEVGVADPVTYVRLGTGAEYGLGEVTVLWQLDVVPAEVAAQELAKLK